MRLYFHIPFCSSKCSYCSFASFVNTKLIDEYFKALEKDLARFLDKIDKIDSIYFGGGTPSIVDAKYYKNIFFMLKNRLNSFREISIEANPNSLSYDWVKAMLDFGVNRFSLGVQSFDDEKLRFLNRTHSAKLALEKINMLNKLNLNFSVDIIYGTHFDNLAFLNKELNVLKDLDLKHLSAYTLILEEGTPLAGKKQFLQNDEEINCYFYNEIQKLGLKAYEISNFAKSEEFRARHNIAYWAKEDYIGLGLGSVGTSGLKRYYASDNLAQYIKNPEQRICEHLSLEDDLLERIFLGLRSLVGVDLGLVKDKKKLKELEENDLIFIKNNKIFNKNYLLSDEIAMYLS